MTKRKTCRSEASTLFGCTFVLVLNLNRLSFNGVFGTFVAPSEQNIVFFLGIGIKNLQKPVFFVISLHIFLLFHMIVLPTAPVFLFSTTGFGVPASGAERVTVDESGVGAAAVSRRARPRRPSAPLMKESCSVLEAVARAPTRDCGAKNSWRERFPVSSPLCGRGLFEHVTTFWRFVLWGSWLYLFCSTRLKNGGFTGF